MPIRIFWIINYHPSRQVDRCCRFVGPSIPYRVVFIKFFDEYFDEVRKHMDYEDKTVFPYVIQLLDGEKMQNTALPFSKNIIRMSTPNWPN